MTALMAVLQVEFSIVIDSKISVPFPKSGLHSRVDRIPGSVAPGSPQKYRLKPGLHYSLWIPPWDKTGSSGSSLPLFPFHLPKNRSGKLIQGQPHLNRSRDHIPGKAVRALFRNSPHHWLLRSWGFRFMKNDPGHIACVTQGSQQQGCSAGNEQNIIQKQDTCYKQSKSR